MNLEKKQKIKKSNELKMVKPALDRYYYEIQKNKMINEINWNYLTRTHNKNALSHVQRIDGEELKKCKMIYLNFNCFNIQCAPKICIPFYTRFVYL